MKKAVAIESVWFLAMSVAGGFSLLNLFGQLTSLFFGLLWVCCLIGLYVAHRQTPQGKLISLERSLKRGFVTPEEYAAKRQEILKDL